MEKFTDECKKRTCERPCTYTFHTHCFDASVTATRGACPVCRGKGDAQERMEMQESVNRTVFSFLNAMAEWAADNISGVHGFHAADAYRKHLESPEYVVEQDQ